MRIRDWSSDVCSSDLKSAPRRPRPPRARKPPLSSKTGAAGGSPPQPAGGQDAGEEAEPARAPALRSGQIGRASWRERVSQYVEISVVAGTLKKNKRHNIENNKTHHIKKLKKHQ